MCLRSMGSFSERSGSEKHNGYLSHSEILAFEFLFRELEEWNLQTTQG